MQDVFLLMLQLIDEMQATVSRFPVSLIVLSLSAASAVTMLIMAPFDYRFERMRLKGITRAALALLLSAIVALGVLSVGLDTIKTARPDVPWWLDSALLGLCSFGFMAAIYVHLRVRQSFTLSRFTNAIVIPLATPIVPFMGVLGSLSQLRA